MFPKENQKLWPDNTRGHGRRVTLQNTHIDKKKDDLFCEVPLTILRVWLKTSAMVKGLRANILCSSYLREAWPG